MSRREFLGLLVIWFIVALFVLVAHVMGSMPQDLLYPILAVLVFTLILIFVFAIREMFE